MKMTQGEGNYSGRKKRGKEGIKGQKKGRDEGKGGRDLQWRGCGP